MNPLHVPWELPGDEHAGGFGPLTPAILPTPDVIEDPDDGFTATTRVVQDGPCSIGVWERCVTPPDCRNPYYARLWIARERARQHTRGGVTKINPAHVIRLRANLLSNQAWVEDGKYVRCGHPESSCYGRHEGESVD